VFANSRGMEMSIMPLYGPKLFIGYQEIGAYFVLSAYLLYVSWPHLRRVLRATFHMEKLDDFTLGLLTNAEVIALDQDALGQQAKCEDTVGDVRVYLKKLEDGSVAVGFCNFGQKPTKLSYANLARLGLTGSQRYRDLWRQRDLGTIEIGREALPLEIPSHGIILLKFSGVPSS